MDPTITLDETLTDDDLIALGIELVDIGHAAEFPRIDDESAEHAISEA